MSEQITLLNKIKTQLTPTVSGNIVVEKSSIELSRNKQFPFVNIQLLRFGIGVADNMAMQHVQRHSYNIQIILALLAMTREEANEDIWDMYEIVKSGLDSDLTFGGLCSKAPIIPNTDVLSFLHEDGKRWVGRIVMTFQLYKDFVMV